MTDLMGDVSHVMIPVNVSGEGPCEREDVDHYVCSCSGYRVVVKFNNGNGMTLCPVTRRMIWDRFPPVFPSPNLGGTIW